MALYLEFGAKVMAIRERFYGVRQWHESEEDYKVTAICVKKRVQEVYDNQGVKSWAHIRDIKPRGLGYFDLRQSVFGLQVFEYLHESALIRSVYKRWDLSEKRNYLNSDRLPNDTEIYSDVSPIVEHFLESHPLFNEKRFSIGLKDNVLQRHPLFGTLRG